MYIHTILFLTLIFSIGIYANNEIPNNKIVQLHNYTGSFVADHLKDAEEICLYDSTITITDGDPNLPGLTLPNLKRFVAKNTKFEAAHEHKWITAPNLENITLDNIEMAHSLHYYKRFKGLKFLNVKNIKIGKTKGHSLEHQKKLESLHLVSAGITGFAEDIFKGLDNLEDLDLSNNKFETIPKVVLEPLKKLRTLVLVHNQFKKFDTDNLPELPELRSIDLRVNPVDKVDLEGLTRVAPKLESVLLGEFD